MIRAVVHFWSAGATAQIAIPEKILSRLISFQAAAVFEITPQISSGSRKKIRRVFFSNSNLSSRPFLFGNDHI